jgi:signal transduction histidine kinase
MTLIYRTFIVFLLSFITLQTSAQTLSYYIDSSATLTIEEVQHKTFVQLNNESIANFDITPYAVWIKVKRTYADSVGQLNYFIIANPLIDTVKLFSWYNNKLTLVSSTGYHAFSSSKKYNHQYQILDISHDSINRTGDYYLQMQSGTQLTFPFTMNTEKSMADMLHQKDFTFAIYLCVLLVMLIYNLFVYITVKDKSYLYYNLYLLASIFTQTSLDGYLHRFVLTESNTLSTLSIYISSALIGLTALEFMRIFIKLDFYYPKGKYFLRVFYGIYGVAVILSFFGLYNQAYIITLINATITSFFALIVSIMVALKGYRPAKFYLLAWAIFILGVWTYVLKDFGILPYNFYTSISLQIGSAIETILLSFALADKINIYRREKEVAQAEALRAALENEKIILEQNVTLELKVTERTKELKSANDELSVTLTNLKETQTQLVESEKMASLGQLTAGIAHEINNPINFVTSNVKPLRRDVDILLKLMAKIEETASLDIPVADKQKQIAAIKTEFDFDYLKEEVDFLLKGINEGSSRTAEIVKGLRIFSRVDEDDLKKADINEGLDSTIIIVNNLLNGKIVITRKYGNLPLAECYPGKLNQVFLNMISNSIYAINKKFNGESGGELIIATESSKDTVTIIFSDNGIGMDEGTLKKLFEPFFTTKPVGEGTGLGLSISYNTIKKHNGTITVKSEVDKGTEFRINIPIIQINS